MATTTTTSYKRCLFSRNEREHLLVIKTNYRHNFYDFHCAHYIAHYFCHIYSYFIIIIISIYAQICYYYYFIFVKQNFVGAANFYFISHNTLFLLFFFSLFRCFYFLDETILAFITSQSRLC